MDSIDAGRRDTVLDALGNAVESRDGKGALTLAAFDVLHRPIRVWARDDAAGPVTLRQRIEYGDGGDPDQPAAERDGARARNLLGQPGRPLRRGRPRHRRATSTSRATSLDSRAAGDRRRARSSPTTSRPPPTAGRSHRSASTGNPARPDQSCSNCSTGATARRRSFDALDRSPRHVLPTDVEGRRRELRPALQPGRRARAGAPRRRRLRRAHRLRRQGPARADRLRQRRDDPLRLRPATRSGWRDCAASATPPTASPTGRAAQPLQDYGYDYDLAGNILAIRDRTPGSGIPNNPDALSDHRPRAGSTADRRRRARPPLHLRPDLPAGHGHRPGVRYPAKCPALKPHHEPRVLIAGGDSALAPLSSRPCGTVLVRLCARR